MSRLVRGARATTSPPPASSRWRPPPAATARQGRLNERIFALPSMEDQGKGCAVYDLSRHGGSTSSGRGCVPPRECLTVVVDAATGACGFRSPDRGRVVPAATTANLSSAAWKWDEIAITDSQGNGELFRYWWLLRETATRPAPTCPTPASARELTAGTAPLPIRRIGDLVGVHWRLLRSRCLRARGRGGGGRGVERAGGCCGGGENGRRWGPSRAPGAVASRWSAGFGRRRRAERGRRGPGGACPGWRRGGRRRRRRLLLLLFARAALLQRARCTTSSTGSPPASRRGTLLRRERRADVVLYLEGEDHVRLVPEVLVGA